MEVRVAEDAKTTAPVERKTDSAPAGQVNDAEQAHRRALAAWRRHLPQGADAQQLLAELADGSLVEAFHRTATRVPDKVALDLDGATLTHRQLDERLASAAGWLREQGVTPRSAVLLACPGSLAMIVAYLAVLRTGASVVLANPTYTEVELHHLLADSGAVAAIGAEPTLGRLQAAGAAVAGLRLVVDVEQVGQGAPLAPEPIASEALAIIAYTSGTTGKPKAVGLTHRNLLSSIRGVMHAWRWSEQDVLVHGLPLFHQHGLGGVHATLIAGSRAVLLSRFSPEALAAAIAEQQASVLFAVPAMYERIVVAQAAIGESLRSLRLLVSGSAPLSPKLAQEVEALAGQVPLERYGTTESGLDISNPYDGPRRIGAVGLPLPGVELMIADGEGAALDDGVDGEIVMRGPQVFSGYLGAEAATRDAFWPGGWFRTGDIGRIDPEDGYLLITGRAKELIITGGMNVYPREVELALEQAPGVAQAAVAGYPSEKWGEEVVAAIVAGEPPLEPEEIIAHARERLAPYKCPKRVVLVKDLPRNAMGKIVRAEVAKLFSGTDG